jgi:hypothetical protein
MRKGRFLGMIAGGLVEIAGCGSLPNTSQSEQVTLKGQLIVDAWDNLEQGVGGVDYSFETDGGRTYLVKFERPGPYVSGQATIHGELIGNETIRVCDGCLDYSE